MHITHDPAHLVAAAVCAFFAVVCVAGAWAGFYRAARRGRYANLTVQIDENWFANRDK